jgi:diguanylate cyclase (GGDEF)-like protein
MLVMAMPHQHVPEHVAKALKRVARSTSPEDFARALETNADVLFGTHADTALGNVRMMSERAAVAREDPLTGLRNHREFQDEVERAERTGDPFAVIVFDLDRFKLVNDRDGHAAGDRLLRASGAAILSACRGTDMAFRVGGDEFALLLIGAGHDDAAIIGERAAHAVASISTDASASYGIAAWPMDGADRSDLLDAADRAMYAMKGAVRMGKAAGRRVGQRSRLLVASRLASQLAPVTDTVEVAQITCDALRSAFGFYLAVVQRLDEDGVLRVVAGAGPLADEDSSFLAWEQPVDSGVNGRVARTGERALVQETRLDPDYLSHDPRTDPGSELSLPLAVGGKVWGVLNLEQLATHAFDADDVLLAELITGQLGASLHRCFLYEELEYTFTTTLGALCDALEAKDEYTADHAGEVADLSKAVGARLGLSDDQQRDIQYAALLHDIGKIGVRSELIAKPSALTDEEYSEIKEHSEIGAQLLGRIPLLKSSAPVVRAIHERWDGGGYPDGLAGEEIPIAARVVGACDALHAMTSDRPYREAMTWSQAAQELVDNAGTQFDPTVVDALLAEAAHVSPHAD